jgi:hypothetical protein
MVGLRSTEVEVRAHPRQPFSLIIALNLAVTWHPKQSNPVVIRGDLAVTTSIGVKFETKLYMRIDSTTQPCYHHVVHVRAPTVVRTGENCIYLYL